MKLFAGLFLVLFTFTAFAATLPFIAFPAVFDYNGGISDFRMDLSLYLFFGLTAVWYLATYETDRLYPWLLVGLAAGVACLARATAPVYLVVSLAPPLLVRLIVSPKRLRILAGAGAATLIMVLTCGWFFYRNGKYLYWYYVVWNTDANANLPIKEAARHYEFVWDALGPNIRTFCIAFGVIIFLTAGVRALGDRFRHPLRLLLKEINWTALYIGLAPVTMLVFRRAGLNPFVALPSCFGLMMFALTFDARRITRKRPEWLGWVLAAYSVIVLVSMGVNGLRRHVAEPVEANMSSHRTIIDTMLGDADAHHVDRFTFAGTHLYYLHSASLSSVLMFDYGFELKDETLRRNNTTMIMDISFQPATRVDFIRATGNDDETKIKGMAKSANESIGYMIFPDEKTMVEVEEKPNLTVYFANVICRRLRDEVLATGKWELITGPVVVSPRETVLLYANRALIPSTNPATTKSTTAVSEAR